MLDRWTPLSELKVGDRIAVAVKFRSSAKPHCLDWEATLLGLMIRKGNAIRPATARLTPRADPAMVKLLEQTVADSGSGETTFKGRYGYRLVNRKGRGGIPESNRAHLWLKSHELNVGAPTNSCRNVSLWRRKLPCGYFCRRLFSGDGGVYHSGARSFLNTIQARSGLIEDVHHLLLRFGVFSRIRNKLTAIGTRAWRVTITDKQQIRRFAERIGFTPGSLKQGVLDEEVLPMILTATALQELLRYIAAGGMGDTPCQQRGWAALGSRGH